LQNYRKRLKLKFIAVIPSMTDEPKHLDPFKPQEPTIPGVTGNPARVKAAPEPPRPLDPSYQNRPAPNPLLQPGVLIAIGVALLLLVGGIFLWHNHSTSAKSQAPVAEVVPSMPVPLPAAAPTQEPAKNVAIGPGPIATTAELAKPWSSKQFVFRAPQTADDVPALVVHLPNNVYWGISLREPFGSCEMQYITDLSVIANQFHYSANHPMVVDPCNGAVYDLDRYGPGPNGEVRGAIVHGAGVRPPLAIQMAARGKQVVALQIEH
jgi:hypothetical protein